MRRNICLSRFPIDPQQLCPARSLDIIADAALQSLALALAAETGKRKQGTLREAGLKLNPLFEAIIHHIPRPQYPSCSSSYRKPQSGSFQHLRRHNKAHYRPSGLDLAVDRGEGVELSGGCRLWLAQGRVTLATIDNTHCGSLFGSGVKR